MKKRELKTLKMEQQNWNSNLYENSHAFVWQYGESLLELLAPQSQESILDLGCGTGQLTEKIATTGAKVSGIDASPTMIETAQNNYPHLHFEVADARNFTVNTQVNAVFSNAVLHWIKEPNSVISCVYQALKSGGRFLAEFGGKGNVEGIVGAISSTLETMGFPLRESPWYFPSLGEYVTLLEAQGFEVTYALLFDRPTQLEGGEAGMANWLRMFANGLLSEYSPDEQTEIIQKVEEKLKPTLYQEGYWIADYRRLQIRAIKVN